MTVEEKINRYLKLWNDREQYYLFSLYIKEWVWGEKPMSIERSERKEYTEIDALIKDADITECLTSKSQYIRECKKWFMENGE